MDNPSSFDDLRQFHKACDVLQSFVLEHQTKPSSPLDVKMALSEYFDAGCYIYAWNYFNLKADLDWHVISLDYDVRSIFMCEAIVTLRSAAEAFAWFLHNCDRSRIFPTDATRHPDGAVSLWVREREIGKISRINFSSVAPEKAKRVEKAFKGIQSYGDEARLKSKLKSIPGLQEIKLPNRSARPSSGCVMLRSPANLCAQVETMLQVFFGIEVPHNQAMELTAQIFGAQSWNHFVAHSDKAVCRLLPVVLLPREEAAAIFYRSASEAIWAFGQRSIETANGRPNLVQPIYLGEGPALAIEGYAGENKPDESSEWGVDYFDDERMRDPEYLALGSHLTRVGDVGKQIQFLYAGGPRASWSVANRRLGRPQELELGQWLFSLAPSQNPARTFMQIETLDDFGKKGDPVTTWLHKTIFRSAGDRVQIRGEYGANLILEAEWPESYRKQFLEMTGLPEDDLTF